MEIRLEYPNYIEQVQIANSQPAKFYKFGEKIPKLYGQAVKLNQGFTWRKKLDQKGRASMCLFDLRTSAFIIKNSRLLDSPRFANVAGNQILRMNEWEWPVIVISLKEMFMEKLGVFTGKLETDAKGKRRKQYRPAFTLESTPITVRMEIHTLPGAANWDVDNHWIYHKCFLDAMKDAGIIPDDNIRYIVAAGETRFIPVSRETDRKLLFFISDTVSYPHIINHVMYRKQLPARRSVLDTISLDTMSEGKPGDVIVNLDLNVIRINIGKSRFSTTGMARALIKVRHQCIQTNKDIWVSHEFYEKHYTYLKQFLMDENIYVGYGL